MGTLVHLGSEPPKKPGADKPAKKVEASSPLRNISLTPQTIGIGAGVVVVLAALLWFAFGRGGGESAATGTPVGNAAVSGGTAAAYPGGAGYPGGDGATSTPAAYPSGGSPAPSAPGIDTSTSAVPAGGTAPGDAVPPPVSMSSGGGGGSSVSSGSGSVQPQVAGSPVSVDATGKTTPADAKSPFRKQPNGQIIDLRDPPTN